MTGVCLPCAELEHDTCHNLLWDAGCPCRHTSWPQDRCQVRGKDKHTNPQQFLCDLPRHHPGSHEGRHWVVPEPVEDTPAWWGWRPTPLRWGWRRTVPPVGKFDPWDPTVPAATDRVVA